MGQGNRSENLREVMLDNLTIQKLRDLPIEGVAERLGLRVSKHTSLCPFHDDSHPSLTFDVRRNRFKCYVCDAHGGAIDLVEKKLGLGFKDACRWLADSSNVILEEWKPADQHSTLNTKRSTFTPEKYRRFFERPFINQAAGEFLFEKRHIDPRVVRWCRLTSYTDRNGIPWLQIPYFDIDGHLTGVQWRNLAYKSCLEGTTREASVTGDEVSGKETKEESGWKPVPRFRFPRGSKCHIYNLPVLKMLKPGEDLWIAEGCSDCWALLSSGRKAIAIPSATLLKPKDLEPLLQLSSSLSSSACPEHVEGLSFHMYPDADVPGERLFYKLKEQLPSLTRHQLPDGYKDFGQYWAASQNVTTLPC